MTKNCVYCYAEIPLWKRVDTRYCDDTCRNKAFYQKKEEIRQRKCVEGVGELPSWIEINKEK